MVGCTLQALVLTVLCDCIILRDKDVLSRVSGVRCGRVAGVEGSQA